MARPPQVIERMQMVRVEVPTPMPYVAMLQPGTEPAQWMVMVMPNRKLLKVAVAGVFPLDQDKQGLQLWVLDDAGTPHPMGMMPDTGTAEMPMPEGMAMPLKPVMAVSVEPKGGSPTGLPTGPVVTTAPLLQL